MKDLQLFKKKILGTGNFGTVYEGLMKNGRSSVAVKIPHKISAASREMFLEELEVYFIIKDSPHSKNAVTMLAFCWETLAIILQVCTQVQSILAA